MSEEQLHKSCQNIKTALLFYSRLIMFIKDMFKSFSTPCSARIWYQSYKTAYIGIWVLHLVSFQMTYLLLMPSFIDSSMSQFAPFSLWTIIESYVCSIGKAHLVGWKHFCLVSSCTFPSNTEGSPLYSISWSGHRFRLLRPVNRFLSAVSNVWSLGKRNMQHI